MMRRLILAAIVALFGILPAAAQNSKGTNPLPAKITTGLTYQVLLPAVATRLSVTIQNNQTTADNCWLIVGGPWVAGDTTSTARTINGISMTGAQASILLTPGGQYSRYYPLIPNDQMLVTCTTTGDSVYADSQ